MKKRNSLLIVILLAVTSLSGCKSRRKGETNWSKWFDNGDGTHSRHDVDDLTIVETEPHTYELLKYTTEPTEVTPGEAQYECSKCGAKEDRKVPPTGNYVFDQKVVDEKYLCERYSDHSASYYMSSKEGAFGNPDYIFEVSDLPDDYTEVDYVQGDGRQWVNTGVKNDGKHKTSVNGSGLSSRLPEGYQEVEYIQGTGFQYIRTGFRTANGMIVKYKANWQEAGYIVGSHGTSEPCGRNGGFIDVIDRDWELGYGDLYPHAEYSAHANTDYEVEFSTTYENAYLKVNEETIITSSGQQTSNTEVMIFASEYHIWQNKIAKAKLYYCKIYDSSNVLVRDYVPAYRKTDSKPGLYDLLENKFYTNSGTDEFLIGNEVYNGTTGILPSDYREIEYIESTGSQYIKTGVIPTLQTGFKGSFMLTQMTGNPSPIAVQNEGTSGRFGFIVGLEWQNRRLYYGKNDWAASQTDEACVTNVKYDVSYNYKNDGLATQDGVYSESLEGRASVAQYELPLFTDCIAGDYLASVVMMVGRIYNFQITEGSSVIRDFVPCVRKNDYKPGLFDIVENKFYVNQTDDEFIVPPSLNALIDSNLSYQFTYDQATGIYSNSTVDIKTNFQLQVQIWSGEGGTIYDGSVVNSTYENITSPTTKSFVFELNDNVTRLRIKHNGTNADIDLANIYNLDTSLKYRFTLTILSANSSLLGGIQLKNIQLIPMSKDIPSSTSNRLPAGYVELDYIQSTGEQYIDTNVIFSSKISYDLEFAYSEVNNDECDILGVDVDPFALVGTVHGQWRFSAQDGQLIMPGEMDTNRHRLTKRHNELCFDNSVIHESLTTITYEDPSYSFYLFAAIDNSELDVNYFSKSKLYTCKMWNEETLIRDFVPCYKKDNNEVGLFDLVSNIFFENQTSVPFIKGNVVNAKDTTRDVVATKRNEIPEYYYQLNYVESTCIQEIDTGIKGNAKVDMKVKFNKSGLIQKMGYDNVAGEFIGINTNGKYFGTEIDSGGIDHFVFDYSNSESGKIKVKINDETMPDIPSIDVSEKYFKLFSAGEQSRSAALLYDCKIYQGENLVRDFVPVMQKYTGISGLFDVVEGRFYTSNTKHELIAGGIVSEQLNNENINIFCNTNTNKSHPNKTQISSYQIYEQNKLTNNFIACIRNSDGSVGFYDLTTKTFVTSSSEFSLTYGSIIGHKLDEGKVVKTPTHDTEGEMVYKCVYTGKEIHTKIDRTAYKVTFIPENNQMTGIKIFNSNNPNDFSTGLVGYTRNENTFNYSKSGAYIYFELPDDGKNYEIITFGGELEILENRQYKIKNIKSDLYVQIRQTV